MLGRRLAEARQRRGLSQTDLAVALDYHQSMVSKIERGRQTLKAEGLVTVSRELGVSLDWLLGLVDAPREDDATIYPHDPAFVRVHSETVGAGYPGQPVEIKEVDTDYPFRAGRLREEGIDPRWARVYQVVGDSMYPVLPDGSTILVDGKMRSLTSNSIFVFRADGGLLVKRAVHWTNGEWWWHSELPSWKARAVRPGDQIMGMVRWVGHGLNYGIAWGP